MHKYDSNNRKYMCPAYNGIVLLMFCTKISDDIEISYKK